MYKIKNGILYKNGKKTFVLGESYYPSFHPCKFPVKPEDDRIGEMKKDLRMMAEAGFNHVRFAALGEVSYDETSHSVHIESPFVDAMIHEAEKNELSTSVRLHGVSVNLRGYTDAEMIDEHGNVPDYVWSNFVRSTLKHKGILEDNFIQSRDLAKHFAAFPSVVAYQIYNEPAFPRYDSSVNCDYNPHTVQAFRTWLTEKKILTEEEAKNYDPPRGYKDQTPEMWALWRSFSVASLDGFLKNAGDGAKEGADKPIFTCLTSDMACKNNSRRGVDAFADAKHMDIVGYTIYKHAWGAEYYPMCLDGDIFQSAAELEEKEAWCIELDSRTYIPSSLYNKGTYATIGSGIKGIVYYQWRGDQPVKGVPHPNSCGILNFDGTKTANFDNAVAVNRWITSINDLVMGTTRAHEGIGLFYSPYALAYCEAAENTSNSSDVFNSSALYLNSLYAELRKVGYTVTVTDREHLMKNRAEIKVLIVPDPTHLSPEDQSAIIHFYEQGGVVFHNVEPYARNNVFLKLSRYDQIERTYEEKVFLPPYTPYDLPELTGIVPIATSLDPQLGIQTLKGEGYTLLVLTNLSPVKQQMDAKLRVTVPYERAEFTAIDGTKNIEIHDDELIVRNMTDGGIVILWH